jgi:hypothetical protein
MPATAVNAPQPRLSKIIGGTDLDQISELEPNKKFTLKRQAPNKVTFEEDLRVPSRPAIAKEAGVGDFSELEPENILATKNTDKQRVNEAIAQILKNSQSR